MIGGVTLVDKNGGRKGRSGARSNPESGSGSSSSSSSGNTGMASGSRGSGENQPEDEFVVVGESDTVEPNSDEDVKVCYEKRIIRPKAAVQKEVPDTPGPFVNEVILDMESDKIAAKEELVKWAKLECCSKYGLDALMLADFMFKGLRTGPPLLVTLGYQSGIQIWGILATGLATEILSWKKPNVRLAQLLPKPAIGDRVDQFRNARPVVAICSGTNFPVNKNTLTFVALKTGKTLKTFDIEQPVGDIVVNNMIIVVTFLDHIQLIDPCTFEVKMTLPNTGKISKKLYTNPVALSSSWLAYTEREPNKEVMSNGGADMASQYKRNERLEPGSVTILDLSNLNKSEVKLDVSESHQPDGRFKTPLIAHFVAHWYNPVVAMSFDPSGFLLVTADTEGQDFNVFRIHPPVSASSKASVQHLYHLERNGQPATVQCISFALDSRWVAVSTLSDKGKKTRIFPIDRLGGPASSDCPVTNTVSPKAELSKVVVTSAKKTLPISKENKDKGNGVTLFAEPRMCLSTEVQVKQTALYSVTSYGILIEYCFQPETSTGKLPVNANYQWNFPSPLFYTTLIGDDGSEQVPTRDSPEFGGMGSQSPGCSSAQPSRLDENGNTGASVDRNVSPLTTFQETLEEAMRDVVEDEVANGAGGLREAEMGDDDVFCVLTPDSD